MTEKSADTSEKWLCRRRHFGDAGGFTPYISFGDSARVLCFMNLSGAYNGYAGQDQAEADARLMASAPELYSALAAAQDFINGFAGDEMQEGIDELLEEISDALARAEGK